MRIAIAGFQHETNTFAPGRAGTEEFRMADSWPALLTGEEILTETVGMNLPIAGAIAAAGSVELVPVLWCAAEPSGPVSDEAFDWISGQILNGVRTALPLDGLYLDLHGAMVTESHEDGEGALLRLLREVVGNDLPIGVSLDLHANISPAMAELATLITVYRTYPHLDMAETGARCFHHLLRAIKGERYTGAFRQAPFLIPLHSQYTKQEPCQGLYQRLAELDQNDGVYAELALGFTAADIHDCGPSVIAYADNKQKANELADEIMNALCSARDQFNTTLVSAAEAVQRALDSTGSKPVVIADVQDNPGAGGTADTTGLLRALIDLGVQNAVLGVICDPEVARCAHENGVGNSIFAALGAKSGLPDQLPVEGRYRILALSDGQIAYTGEMYGGGVAELGLSCLLAPEDVAADIRIVVSSIRIQCLDQALFTHFGVDLAQTAIICVKSTVHHRADFEPIASEIINAAAPGAFSCRLSPDQFQHLRPGVECL